MNDGIAASVVERLGPFCRTVLFLSACCLFSGCGTFLGDRGRLGLCGDGSTQAGEECDDGNTTSGDGCSATCLIEACGNGETDAGEECDNGVANDNGSDCTLACRWARCGDGYVKSRGTGPYEVCDDGNHVNGDGCNPTCSLRGRLTVFDGTPGGMGVADGTGSAARFAGIRGMALDADERTLYVSDERSCTLKQMDLETGQVSLLAGTPNNCLVSVDGPADAATLGEGDTRSLATAGDHLYLAESPALTRVDLSSPRREVATCGFALSPTGQLHEMAGLAYSESGSALFVATRYGILQVDLPCDCSPIPWETCQLTLVAGSWESSPPVNAQGTDARFSYVSGVAIDPAETTLYIADAGLVRSLDLSTLQVDFVAGSIQGHKDGFGAEAQFGSMQSLECDEDAVYVPETSVSANSGGEESLGWGDVRRLDRHTGEVTTIAGTYGPIAPGQTPEVDGFGFHARFLEPWVARLWKGNELLIGTSSAIRAISLETHQVATAAGTLVQDLTRFGIRSVAARSGAVYVPTYDGKLMEIPIPASQAARELPICAAGSDRPHRIDAIAVDDTSIYLADYGIQGICRIDLTGTAGQPCCPTCQETCQTVFSSTSYPYWNITGLAFDGHYLYFTNRSGMGSALYQVDPEGQTVVPVNLQASANGASPVGIVAVDGALYLTLEASNQVIRVDPETAAVRPLVSGAAATQDGKGNQASICHPAGIATDGHSLFVGETVCPWKPPLFQGHAIRQIDLVTEEVTTLVGPGPKPYLVEGTGMGASVNRPAAIAVEPSTGTLFVADEWDNVLLQID